MARLAGAALTSVVVLLAVARNGCDEQSSCTSFLGNGTAEWPYAAAVLVAVAAGGAAFALLTALRWFWRTYSAQDDTIS